MKKNNIIISLKKRLEDIEAKIQNCKDIIENTATPIHMKEEREIEELEKEKERIENKIQKFEDGKETLVDSVKISFENMIDKLSKRIKDTSMRSQIEIDDVNLARETLKKNEKTISEYTIDVEIEQIETKEKKHTATRLIIIKNKKTGNAKKYPASMSEEHLWNLEFDKDLKSGYFEKK